MTHAHTQHTIYVHSIPILFTSFTYKTYPFPTHPMRTHRAAFVHVVTDAFVSVIVIVALCVAKYVPAVVVVVVVLVRSPTDLWVFEDVSVAAPVDLSRCVS